jgi:hypothetical protein
VTWAVSGSGTQTAVVNTEHNLATDTINGTYYFQVRCNNLQPGDVVELRIYTMTLSGGTLEQTWKTTVGPSIPVSPVLAFPPQPSDVSIKVTLKQIAGTARAFDWKLLRT